MSALHLAALPEGEPDALAWDLHAGCAWCGALTRDLVATGDDLACAACRELDAEGETVTVAGVTIPAGELGRPEAVVASRASAVAALLDETSAWAVAREGREMDRAVARVLRGAAAAALGRVGQILRTLPSTPSGEELDALARAVVENERAVARALRWELQRAEVRSLRRRRS